MESIVLSACQTALWLDLWPTTVDQISSSSMGNTEECAASFRLLQCGGKTIYYMAHLTANVWPNLVLNRRDASLSKVSKLISMDSILALQNGDILTSVSLLPKDQLDSAIDKLSRNHLAFLLLAHPNKDLKLILTHRLGDLKVWQYQTEVINLNHPKPRRPLRSGPFSPVLPGPEEEAEAELEEVDNGVGTPPH